MGAASCSVTLTHIPADEHDWDWDLAVSVSFQPRTECDWVSIAALLRVTILQPLWWEAHVCRYLCFYFCILEFYFSSPWPFYFVFLCLRSFSSSSPSCGSWRGIMAAWLSWPTLTGTDVSLSFSCRKKETWWPNLFQRLCSVCDIVPYFLFTFVGWYKIVTFFFFTLKDESFRLFWFLCVLEY